MTVPVPEQLVAAPGRRSLAGYLVTPVLLALVLLALYLYVNSRPLDSIEARRVNIDFISQATLQHITLTVVSTALVLLIAIPVGILLTRPFARRITPAAVAVFNIGQAVPSIGLLVLFAIGWASASGPPSSRWWPTPPYRCCATP
jgi:ABC-type proline/glycine betaine transport systems, permease component